MTLDEIAIKTGTDKSSKHHNYCHTYESYFAPLRNKQFTFIEAGIGGYEYKDRGGQSLLMWQQFFPHANIVGIDLYDKSGINAGRAKIYKGSQDNAEFLKSVIEKEGSPLIFIDDASHINDLCLKTFEIVFPLLPPQAIYVVEDIETSFSSADWCRGTDDYNDFQFPSSVNLGRKLINDVNAKFIGNYTTQHQIESIHFHQNLLIIKKK